MCANLFPEASFVSTCCVFACPCVSVFVLSGGQLRRVIKCRSRLGPVDRPQDVGPVCPHGAGWMVRLGKVCVLSVKQSGQLSFPSITTAVISWPVGEVSQPVHELSSIFGLTQTFSSSEFCFASVQYRYFINPDVPSRSRTRLLILFRCLMWIYVQLVSIQLFFFHSLEYHTCLVSYTFS